jgi:hypothetical protein
VVLRVRVRFSSTLTGKKRDFLFFGFFLKIPVPHIYAVTLLTFPAPIKSQNDRTAFTAIL